MPNIMPLEILTPEETAALLRVEVSWVYSKSRRRQRNPLPVHRIGKYLRYTKSEVLAWFAAQVSKQKLKANY
jgi:predicted DNA-binding transcriptional regulator AlpA